MPKAPSAVVPLYSLAEDYGAVDFEQALAEFVVSHCKPEISRGNLAWESQNLALPVKVCILLIDEQLY